MHISDQLQGIFIDLILERFFRTRFVRHQCAKQLCGLFRVVFDMRLVVDALEQCLQILRLVFVFEIRGIRGNRERRQ